MYPKVFIFFSLNGTIAWLRIGGFAAMVCPCFVAGLFSRFLFNFKFAEIRGFCVFFPRASFLDNIVPTSPPPCRLRSPSLFPPTAAHTQFLLQTNPYFAALVEVLLVVGLALPFSLDDPATAAAEWLVGLCPAHPLEEKG